MTFCQMEPQLLVRPSKRLTEKSRPEGILWRIEERVPIPIPRTPSVNYDELRRHLKLFHLGAKHKLMSARYRECEEELLIVTNKITKYQRKLQFGDLGGRQQRKYRHKVTKHQRRAHILMEEVDMFQDVLEQISDEAVAASLWGREQCSVM